MGLRSPTKHLLLNYRSAAMRASASAIQIGQEKTAVSTILSQSLSRLGKQKNTRVSLWEGTTLQTARTLN